MLDSLNTAVRLLIDSLFPPKCIICQELIAYTGGLCADCWSKIDFNCHPACGICSLPFEYEVHEGAICPACIKNPPIYHKAYSVFRFSDHSKKIIHNLKYHDATYLAPYLASLDGKEFRCKISI